jgi:hypothetical protein
MRAEGEKGCADLALRVLLGGAAPAAGDVDWPGLLAVARRNGVLVRLGHRFEETGTRFPAAFAGAVREGRQRVRERLDLLRRIARLCSENGIAFMFPKAFQHYPDMGDDIDLFVLSGGSRVDGLIARTFHAARERRGLGDCIAGTVNYRVPGCAAPLEIHHGRMGSLGEHRGYLEVLVKYARRGTIDGTEFLVPRPEDQLVVQGMQKVYGRRRLKIADVIATIGSVRQDDLDWNYILTTAGRLGTSAGLGCYLGYVDQVHRALFGAALLPAGLGKVLALDGWGRVEFRDGYYRFPSVWVAGRLYLKKFCAAARAGDWTGAGRLCLLPLLGLTAVLRGLRRRGGAACLIGSRA